MVLILEVALCGERVLSRPGMPLNAAPCRWRPRVRAGILGVQGETFMRKIFAVCYTAAMFIMLAAAQETPRPATNRELLAKGKVFFIKSDTYYVKKEEIEKGLLKNEDLDRLGVQVTENENEADFVLKVKRAAFQNNFPYTVTDRYTGRIIMAGEPNSFGGTVPGKIAADIARKLKRIYDGKDK